VPLSPPSCHQFHCLQIHCHHHYQCHQSLPLHRLRQCQYLTTAMNTGYQCYMRFCPVVTAGCATRGIGGRKCEYELSRCNISPPCLSRVCTVSSSIISHRSSLVSAVDLNNVKSSPSALGLTTSACLALTQLVPCSCHATKSKPRDLLSILAQGAVHAGDGTHNVPPTHHKW